MATKERVKKLENDVKRLHSLRGMKAFLLKEHPTKENQEGYYAADDRLDEKLDILFADSLMYFKLESPHLYDLYMKYTKEQVKAKLLRRITKVDEEQNYYQLAIKRLGELEKELKAKPAKSPKRIQYINKNLTRLRAWTKDLNYETRKKENYYKR